MDLWEIISWIPTYLVLFLGGFATLYIFYEGVPAGVQQFAQDEMFQKLPENQSFRQREATARDAAASKASGSSAASKGEAKKEVQEPKKDK